MRPTPAVPTTNDQRIGVHRSMCKGIAGVCPMCKGNVASKVGDGTRAAGGCRGVAGHGACPGARGHGHAYGDACAIGQGHAGQLSCTLRLGV